MVLVDCLRCMKLDGCGLLPFRLVRLIFITFNTERVFVIGKVKQHFDGSVALQTIENMCLLCLCIVL